MTHKIDVDDEVWAFLKNHAEPFEDTPNSVLRRLLFGRDSKRISASEIKRDGKTPSFPSGVPAALQQILEVSYLVLKQGYSRKEATNIVAKRRGVAPQTVIDKYCRQLDKRAYEIDMLLENLPEFKRLLQSYFPNHQYVIDDYLNDFE